MLPGALVAALLGARSTRTLGRTKEAVQRSSRKCACRRELNSHERQSREKSGTCRGTLLNKCSSQRRPIGKITLSTLWGSPKHCRSKRGKSPERRRRTTVPHQTLELRWKHRFLVSLLGRRSQQGQPWATRARRRLEVVAHQGCQRGAGSLGWKAPGVTGPWQAHLTLAYHAVRPNPSLKRSTNGRPPGPGPRYGVHFLSPGPGVLPLSTT